MIIIAQYIVIFFGLFFIFAGLLMLFAPKKANAILRKAGSTNLINYAEITIRMIPAIALVIYSDSSKYPEVFKVIGWFMIATSIVLYFVPRQLHHRFSVKAADFLKPICFQLLSPFSILIGIAIMYSVI